MNWRGKKGLAVAFAFLMVTSVIAIPMLTGNGFSPTDDGLFGSSESDDGVESDLPPATDDEDGDSDETPEETPEASDEADEDDSGWSSTGGGSSTGSSEPHPRESANVTYPSTDANSTVALLQNARSHVENATDAEAENETEAAHFEASDSDTELTEATTNINASIEEYRIEIFATSTEAFSYQHTAQQQLEGAEPNASSEIDAARADIHLASNISARLAANEAYRLVTEHEFTHSSNEDDADDALEAAGDALERGDEASMTASTVEYEAAWEHAMDAISAVDADDEPDLELQRGSAVERNGTVTVPVGMQVTAVEPYDYEEAEVEIDNETETIDLRPEATLGGTATGSIEVDVGTDLEHRTVTVTVPNGDGELTESLEIALEEDDVRWEPPAPDEYNSVSISDDASGVTVDAGGDGLYEDVLEVSDQTPESDDEYRAGPMVRIQNQTAIDSANVTIPLEEGADPAEGDLSIYTWDPDSDGAWSAINTTIDAENGTATAEVDGFSFFSVFWIEEWEDQTSDVVTIEESDGDDNGTDFEPVDVVFVVDESGSMRGDPISFARDGAQRFTGALFENEQGGLVGFSAGSTLKQELTTDHDALNESIETLNAGGGTNTGSGLRTGINELEDNGWDNRSQTIILLADGRTTRGPNAVSVAEDAADKDIEISTIGLGSAIDETELREIAAATGGDFYHVEESEDLPNAFERVAQNQTEIDLEDTNGDGIPDIVAEMNLTMPSGTGDVAGEPLNLSPLALDTSGDGLQDNETVEIEYRGFEEDGEIKVEAQVTHAKAHPARYDTAGNGLSDYEELEIGTNPFLADTSGDGLIDSVDPEPLEKTLPPEVRFESLPWYQLGMDVETRPSPGGQASSVEELTIREYYEEYIPNSPYQSGIGADWQNETYQNLATDGQWDDVWTDLKDDRRPPGAVSNDASKIAIESIDDDGNMVLTTYDIDNETTAVYVGKADEVRAALIFGAGGTVGIKSGAAALGKIIGQASAIIAGAGTTTIATGGVAAAVGAPVAAYWLLHEPFEGNTLEEPLERAVPLTGTTGTFETPDNLNQVDESEITIPSGATYGHEGTDIETVHGWEQIAELSSIGGENPEYIEEILRDGTVVDDTGEFDIVIDETGTHDVALWILDGTLVFAQETIQKEEVSEEINEEIDEIDISDEIEDTIRDDPDETIEPGNSPVRTFVYTAVGGSVRIVVHMVGDQIIDYIVERIEDDDDREGDQLEVTFIDVGTGLSILVDGPEDDDTMLVDAGRKAAGDDIVTELRDRDVDTIDRMVLTHNHSDHIGGAPTVLEEKTVNEVYYSGVTNENVNKQDDLTEALSESDAQEASIERGDDDMLTPSGDSYEIEVLNPQPGEADDIGEDPTGIELDRSSILLQLEYNGQRFFLTSDIRSDRERDLLEDPDINVDADVLKAGHHGSNTGNSEDFLSEVDPAWVVISSGEPSIAQHNPDVETIERLSETTSSDLLWTAEGAHHATITITTAGEDITSENVDTEYDETTDPDEIKIKVEELKQ